jgi:hypothetical protein
VSAAAPEAAPGTAPIAERCPLCGTPLAPDQEWCLRCGAAARTRLAAAPNWRVPLATMAVLAALALGVLAAALVKLAADSGPTPPASTSVVTSTVAATTSTPLTTVPGATSSTPTTASTPPASGVAPTARGKGVFKGLNGKRLRELLEKKAK